MKKLVKFFILLAMLAAVTTAQGQKKIKEGVVKFELADLDTDAMEAAMMEGSTLDFYFSKKMNRMDINMLAGLMRMQTIVPNNSPKDATLLMDVMGQKFQIVGLKEDELSNSSSMLGLAEASKVSYDKKDTKKIAGYTCHKATLTMNNGAEVVYYVTESIAPPAAFANRLFKNLKGFPLEMNIDTGQGFVMTFRATEAQKGTPADAFKIPADYQKMTMEEFGEKMGGLNLDFGN